MKNKFIAFLISICPLISFSQSNISVKDITATMSKGSQPGFETEILSTGIRDVDRDWKNRLTLGSKAKATETNGELAVHGVNNKLIAPQLFNVYTQLATTPAGVKMMVWFTYNDTVFFAPKTTEGIAAQRYLHDFAEAEYYLALKSSYQKERVKLEKLKDDQEKSIRQQEKAALRIAENKRLIARARDDLTTNANDQKEATATIALQQAELNKVRNGNADTYKAAEKAMSDDQAALKKLQDRNEELHKRIDNWNKEIATQQRDITAGQQTQTQTTDAIAKQKALIADLHAKLKGN